MFWKMTVCAISAGMCVVSAHAQVNRTLNAVITKGIVISTKDYSVPIIYRPDGTYAGKVGQTEFKGRWRLEGNSICAASGLSPQESCIEYPDDMRPGDRFEVTSPALGRVSITINE